MPITPIADLDFFLNVAKSVLTSAAAALECNNLDVPDRFFVGFDRPPQDCCPELVAWLGNIRTWDGDFPDTRRQGNLLCGNGYSFDITIRIGRCFIDYTNQGPMDAGDIEDLSSPLYRDAVALYFGWIAQWRAGNVSELTQCDLVNAGPMTQYHEGGCAGHEFTITVGVL